MSGYASDKLAHAMGVLADHKGNAAIGSVFDRVWENSSGQNNQLAMTYLFGDVRLEISFARLSQRSKERAFQKLNRLASDFHMALNNTNWDGFKQKFSAASAKEALEDISDLLDTSGLPKSMSLDRDAISSKTTSLINEIESKELPEEIVTLARIKLLSVERLLDQPQHATDAMIAVHVKSVVADLLTDLDPFLKDETALKEKIVSWGRVGTHATVFALGLLADASAVHDLIAGPDETPLLEAPAEQNSDK